MRENILGSKIVAEGLGVYEFQLVGVTAEDPFLDVQVAVLQVLEDTIVEVLRLLQHVQLLLRPQSPLMLQCFIPREVLLQLVQLTEGVVLDAVYLFVHRLLEGFEFGLQHFHVVPLPLKLFVGVC